ncbi:MAG: hypothetical protein K0S32_227 [Bacteroidetes bacterium]|jgi:hypothetical protein|nr:hypothetical protein [Bacteroidota bacterium]
MKTKLILFSALLMASCGSDQEVKKNDVDWVAMAPLKKNNELAKILPAKIERYISLKAPEGMDIKLKNATFSFTTQKYHNGNDTIYIELHDYRDALSMYDQYSKMWWASNDEVNNEMKISKYLSFGPNIDAWEVWERDDNKRSTVYVGVRNRYYMIFECFGRDNTDFIRDVAARFDYSSL